MCGRSPPPRRPAEIGDGATVAVSGSGGGLLEADTVLRAIEARFLATGHPRDLTVVHALGIGDGKGSGIGRLAHEGLVARVIGGHWSWSPAMQRLALEEKIEAYTLPAGVIMTLFREIGAGRPGLITHIGLGTFADPLHGGGKCNRRTTRDIVERIEIDGRHLSPLQAARESTSASSGPRRPMPAATSRSSASPPISTPLPWRSPRGTAAAR